MPAGVRAGPFRLPGCDKKSSPIAVRVTSWQVNVIERGGPASGVRPGSTDLRVDQAQSVG